MFAHFYKFAQFKCSPNLQVRPSVELFTNFDCLISVEESKILNMKLWPVPLSLSSVREVNIYAEGAFEFINLMSNLC